MVQIELHNWILFSESIVEINTKEGKQFSEIVLDYRSVKNVGQHFKAMGYNVLYHKLLPIIRIDLDSKC